MSLSALCLECGLCCDGTLFRQVRISADERARLVTLGIGVGTKKKGDVMWLPCGKLNGRCCTIYDARPGGCRRFVCALGAKLERGEVSFDDAMLHVRDIQARLEVLRAALRVEPGALVLRAARDAIDGVAPVADAVREAFKRVEDLRYGVFMPPPPRDEA